MLEPALSASHQVLADERAQSAEALRLAALKARDDLEAREAQFQLELATARVQAAVAEEAEAKAAGQLASMEGAARSAWQLAAKETELRAAVKRQQRLRDAALRAITIIESQESLFKQALNRKGAAGVRDDIAEKLEAAKAAAFTEASLEARQLQDPDPACCL